MSFPKFQRTAVTDTGDVISGATITVRDQNTGIPANIYSNRAGSTSKPNPFTTGPDGLIEFFAENGEYRIEVVGGSGSIEWEYVQLGGTAATRDVGTGAGNVMEVGAFGRGSRVPIILTGDFDDFTEKGETFFTVGGFPNAPSNAAFISDTKSGITSGKTRCIQNAYDYSGARAYLRGLPAGGFTEWVEYYTTKSLNTLEFSASGAGKRIAQGLSVTSSVAIFLFPTDLLEDASSITVTGTFDVTDSFGNIVTGGASIVPAVSVTRSPKFTAIAATGLSGLTVNQPLYLISVDTTSKIVVNP